MSGPVEGPWSRMLNGCRTGDVRLESRTNGPTARSRSARVETTRNEHNASVLHSGGRVGSEKVMYYLILDHLS